jgi:hypothetical protein
MTQGRTPFADFDMPSKIIFGAFAHLIESGGISKSELI